MELRGITWMGSGIDDPDLLDWLPGPLRTLLGSVNGFVLFGGALHVRGAVRGPGWHSLRGAWRGPVSLRDRYPALEREDIPFGQDCVGDQFLLRSGDVCRLIAETGEVEPLSLDLFAFLEEACRDPVELLQAAPLVQFQADGDTLAPGELLFAYPPFCTQEARDGVSLKALPAASVLHFHAEFAKQISDVEEGGTIRVEIVESS